MGVDEHIGEQATLPTALAAAGRTRPRADRELLVELDGRIGQCELIRPLGRGGMGTVYLARDTRLGRLVAIKIVRNRELHSAERFWVEARATARCVHENIVVIHDIGEYCGHLYMALEYLPGVTLKEWLDCRRAQPDVPPVPVDVAIELMLPVVRALVCAHDAGIVHRDLKPSNIMLTDAGVVKVLDFGVAKLIEVSDPSQGDDTVGREPSPAAELTVEGHLIGSDYYMSPEQRGADQVDHRSDIWAIGMILYELVTGSHPLRGRTWTNLDEVANLNMPMPRAGEARADLGALASIIDRCLIKRKTDRIGSARQLLAELEALAPEVASAVEDASPYTGLAAFQETDARRFCGRTRDVAYAAVLLREQPLLAVVGPSGAGKSSFVRAGLVPALKHSGDAWESLAVRPGRHPLAALATMLLNEDTDSSGASGESDRDALIARLRQEPGYLGARLRTRSRRKLRHILVFVDQFEELYTLGADTDERLAFSACLEAVADDTGSPLRVVIAIRSDFLDRLTEATRLMSALVGGILLLPPLTRDGLRESLVRPLEGIGHRFENQSMVEEMLDVLARTDGALPLLQFTAAKLWESRDRTSKLLTEACYHAIGGVAGTLASHADAVLASMLAQDWLLARKYFERLVTPEHTRAFAPVAELRELVAPDSPEQAERVLTRLVEARLLVVESDAELGATATLVHESLIERWPTLGRWLDEHREDAAMVARVRSAAKQWRETGCPDGLLWRDEAMLDARRWRRRWQGELPHVEAEFLSAVFALAERSARRRRLSIGGVFAAAVLAVAAMAVLAWSSGHAAQRAEREAMRARDAARLAATRELEDDPTRALALLREVEQPAEHHAWPALAAKVLRAPVAEAVFERMGGVVWIGEFSPDGRHVVTAAGEAAWVWDLDGAGPPRVLRGHQQSVFQVSYSPDGRHILTSSWDGTARVWDADGSGAPVVLRQPERISFASFSPDGRKVATVSWDKAAWIWNADGSGAPVILRGHTDRIRRVYFSPDGTRVVTGSRDGTARIWNADGSGAAIVLAGHTQPIWEVRFSPDGQKVATASEDRSARVWNADGTGVPVVLIGHKGGVEHVSFSPDGRRVVTSSWDRTARVWNADGSGTPLVLEGHGGPLSHAVFSPDGRHIVTCSGDKTARLWRSDGSGEPDVLGGFEQAARYAAFSRDGARVLVTAADGSARVWNAEQPQAPVVLVGPVDHETHHARFSPDGRRVLTFPEADGMARLDYLDGSRPATMLIGHTAPVRHAEFSADGALVVTASDDGSARVWNADGTGAPVVLDAHDGPLTSASLSRDGTKVVTASWRAARVWNADGSGAPVVLKARGKVAQVAFSPDGSRVLVRAVDDFLVQVWKADGTGDPVILPGHQHFVHWSEWSPDGTRVVTASGDRSARVWNADGSGMPIVLRGHTHEVRYASFSPDGKHVLTASDDGTARVWNPDGSGVPVVLSQRDQAVRFAQFTPEGERVVTASDDAVRVWRIDGRGVPLLLAGYSAPIATVTVSPDGTRVATSTRDGKTYLWANVGSVPTMDQLDAQLWAASAYCMPVIQRRELLGVAEAAAREDFARCRARVVRAQEAGKKL